MSDINIARNHYTNMASLRSVQTGMNPPREDCRPMAQPPGIHSCCTNYRDVMFVLLYQIKYKTQKVIKLTNFRDLRYAMNASVCHADLVSMVGKLRGCSLEFGRWKGQT